MMMKPRVAALCFAVILSLKPQDVSAKCQEVTKNTQIMEQSVNLIIAYVGSSKNQETALAECKKQCERHVNDCF